MKQENNLKWVIDVQTMDTYNLYLTFNDGCQKLFDCEPLMELMHNQQFLFELTV